MSTENPYRSPQAESQPPIFREVVTRSAWWVLFSFRGRLKRGTFWVGLLLTFLLWAACTLPLASTLITLRGIEPPDQEAINVLAVMLLVANAVNLWMMLAICAKRWHDRDKSGWWTLVLCVPVAGAIYWFVDAGCRRGTVGANRFGPDPTRVPRTAVETLHATERR